MLEFGRIASMYWHGGPIHMQLTHNAAPSYISRFLHQLRTECPFLRAFPKTQQTNQNISFGIFIREESLPATIGGIIAPEELDGFRADFVVDFVELRRSEWAMLQVGKGICLPRLLGTARLDIPHRSPSCDSTRVHEGFLNFRSHSSRVGEECPYEVNSDRMDAAMNKKSSPLHPIHSCPWRN